MADTAPTYTDAEQAANLRQELLIALGNWTALSEAERQGVRDQLVEGVADPNEVYNGVIELMRGCGFDVQVVELPVAQADARTDAFYDRYVGDDTTLTGFYL